MDGISLRLSLIPGYPETETLGLIYPSFRAFECPDMRLKLWQVEKTHRIFNKPKEL